VSADGYLGKLLPAIGNYVVIIALLSTTQIQNQAIFTNFGNQLIESVKIDPPLAKYPGSYDHMGSSPLKPACGIQHRDAAADLQAARPGSQRL
jgi:hypothetical protein